MAVRQTIAIIGATGNMGSALAGVLAESNYRLLLLSMDVHRVRQLQTTIQRKVPGADVDALHCIKDGCWEADIIILAVPAQTEKEVAEKIKEVATQKIVISVSNPQHTEHAPDNGTNISIAELLQQVLPWSKVVKAFNTISANELSAKTANSHIVSYIAGNDEEALQEVSRLVQRAGLTPVIVGDLSVSRKLENHSGEPIVFKTGTE